MHDTLVNQLLTKIDGVDSLNNILLIGMTNRKDMLDEALLRPGRLEVQVEIGLPDDKGRLQILKVPARQLRTTCALTQSAAFSERFSPQANAACTLRYCSLSSGTVQSACTDSRGAVTLLRLQLSDHQRCCADPHEQDAGELVPGA